MSKLDYSNLDQVPKLVCSNLEKCSNKILNLDKCTNWTIPILTSVQIQILTDVQIRSFKFRPVSKLNCSTLRTLCCLLLVFMKGVAQDFNGFLTNCATCLFVHV